MHKTAAGAVVAALPSGSTGEVGGGTPALPESSTLTSTSAMGVCPSPPLSPSSNSENMTTVPMTNELILPSRIRSVPRCLFGPPDPLTADFARKKVLEIQEQDKKKYNFDFQADQPLEGPYKWEAVPVTLPTTTSGTTGSSSYAPKAFSRHPFLLVSLSRLPYSNCSQERRQTSSQPPITRYYLPSRKRPASTTTTKAATDSAPDSSAASTEKKRAAL